MRTIVEKEKNPSLALRVRVEPGGCHGFTYSFDLDPNVEMDDRFDTATMFIWGLY